MEIVTGLRGTPHISSDDVQGFQMGIVGTGSYALNVGQKFKAELASNNELKIYDGEGVMQGVHFRVLPGTYDSVTLQNGSQGRKRIDLIVARYTKNASTGVENIVWSVKKGTETTGTPVAPTATVGDIRAGDTVAEAPWYEVEYDGLTVKSVTQKFTIIQTAQEIRDRIESQNFKNSIFHTDNTLDTCNGILYGIAQVYNSSGVTTNGQIPPGEVRGAIIAIESPSKDASYQLWLGWYGKAYYRVLKQGVSWGTWIQLTNA